MDKATNAARRRLSLIFLWLFVLITAIGLGDALRRYLAPGRALRPEIAPPPSSASIPSQPPAVVSSVPEVPQPQPQPAPVAAQPAPRLPGLRHFEEHLSTESPAGNTANGWHPGQPVFTSQVVDSDAFGNVVAYWLESGNIVEYDREANRYREWARDELETPEGMQTLDSLHNIGGLELQ